VDSDTQTEVTPPEVSDSYLKFILSTFQWTTSYARELERILTECVTAPVSVARSIGQSTFRAASRLVDMVFGPQTHEAEFSCTLFGPHLSFLKSKLTAGLRLSMSSAMEKIPKMLAEIYVRLEAKPFE
jgi:hypothetical protein